MLTGDRFTLVPLVKSHAAALFPVLSDPAIYPFLDTGPPASVDELSRTFERRESRCSPDGRELWLNWGLQLESGEWAGHLQATVFEPGSSWVAYVLASRFWGRGLARDAVQLMMAHLAAEFVCRRFLASVERANHRSIRLLQGLDFALAPAMAHTAHGLDAGEALYCFDVHRTPSES